MRMTDPGSGLLSSLLLTDFVKKINGFCKCRIMLNRAATKLWMCLLTIFKRLRPAKPNQDKNNKEKLLSDDQITMEVAELVFLSNFFRSNTIRCNIDSSDKDKLTQIEVHEMSMQYYSKHEYPKSTSYI